MNPETLTILFKGMGMLLALVGGILVARYGYHLYRDGAGHGRDEAGFEVWNVRVKAHSVGSVVMSTAFLWGLLAVWLSPNLERAGDTVRVYSLQAPGGNVEVRELAANAEAEPKTVTSDPARLKVLLTEAVANTNQTPPLAPLATLDGKPAVIDVLSIKAVPGESGSLLLWTLIHSDGKSASIQYQPKEEKGKVTFVPVGFSRSDKP